MIHEEGRTARPPESSRTNADDRLPRAPLGRVEGGDGFVEGRDVADVRPQSSVPHPLDNLIQLGAIGLDNEVDRQAVAGCVSVGRRWTTSVPPARIRPADALPDVGRPMTSNTRSTLPTSSRVSLSRSTNSCAPTSSAFGLSAARPVPMT